MNVITLNVNGVQYTRFENAKVDRRLDALADTFSFELSAPKDLKPPFSGGENCSISINNVRVLTGRIKVLDISYNNSSHTIMVAERDKTGDFIDSTLDSIGDITPPISLKQIIEKTISHLQLDISVIDNVNPEPFNRAEDVVAPEPGENAYAYAERYARKRQTLLTSDAYGNIVITNASGSFRNSPVRNQINGVANNVLSGSASFNLTGRFKRYKVVSSANPSALIFSGDIGVDAVVDQNGLYTNPDITIRKGRQYIIDADVPSSDGQCISRAEWEASIRKTRSKVYSAIVDGFHTAQGVPWDVNIVVPVVDDFCGVNARMLINTVLFSQSTSAGSLTTLGFVDRKSYSLALLEPEKTNEDIGDGFSF